MWNFSHDISAASDHLPVGASLGNDGAVASRSFPRWLAKTPEYEKQCNIIFANTRIPDGTSFETMCRYKGLLQEAAKRSLETLADGSAISLEQRIYWTLVLLRQHLRPEGRSA